MTELDECICRECEKQGEVVVLDRRTALAIAAGCRAITNSKKYDGAAYVYDIFGEEGGPYEIPYAEAARILNEIWQRYPLTGGDGGEGHD